MTATLDLLLRWVFLAYLLLVGSYLILQTVFAERAHRRTTPSRSSTLPTVDVVIPCYNEDPAELAACLDSIARQDYAGEIRVHVVDDGSPNRAELEPVYQKFRRRKGNRVILLPANMGKRHAQAQAIVDSDGEVVISVDSDTEIDPDGVRRLVAALDDPTVGAAMGEMRAANASVNWLTRIIDRRYWYACNQERAAQSLFGSVLCCSGPFSAYRRSVLERTLDDYLNQTFRNRPSTHGEDRHLTNLVLGTGMRTVYVGAARAATVVPERLKPFLRQQLRWNRCVYRDMAAILPRLPARGFYLVLDAVVQLLAPALLAATLVLLTVRGFSGFGYYGSGLALVALGHCAYGVWRTRSLGFLSFALYGLMHVVLLIPVRVHALLTLSDDRWGQRATAPPRAFVPSRPPLDAQSGD
ncbi:glycosyltransferase family 2 protein [Kutzneria chonburiensis]|uniref:Hyaluronan synthase n=1 Tax=Kutzneria chonburiensis TaxID=1483604 RepID=A0ABV6MMS0_9PSEU|nr:glycosyltransferase family 2 protein [Kutzneria chonburiensis]